MDLKSMPLFVFSFRKDHPHFELPQETQVRQPSW